MSGRMAAGDGSSGREHSRFSAGGLPGSGHRGAPSVRWRPGRFRWLCVPRFCLGLRTVPPVRAADGWLYACCLVGVDKGKAGVSTAAAGALAGLDEGFRAWLKCGSVGGGGGVAAHAANLSRQRDEGGGTNCERSWVAGGRIVRGLLCFVLRVWVARANRGLMVNQLGHVDDWLASRFPCFPCESTGFLEEHRTARHCTGRQVTVARPPATRPMLLAYSNRTSPLPRPPSTHRIRITPQ